MKIGDEYPVWWETFDGRPAGCHKARILDILPYNGPFSFVKCIVRLTAPTTKRGYIDMSVCY